MKSYSEGVPWENIPSESGEGDAGMFAELENALEGVTTADTVSDDEQEYLDPMLEDEPDYTPHDVVGVAYASEGQFLKPDSIHEVYFTSKVVEEDVAKERMDGFRSTRSTFYRSLVEEGIEKRQVDERMSHGPGEQLLREVNDHGDILLLYVLGTEQQPKTFSE